MPRSDSRKPDQLRAVTFQPDIAPNATGSVLVSFGKTQVICAATVQDEVPRWMKMQGVSGGWLTAEYSMLPYSTLDRKDRDISKGKLDGRSQEIQRLIGRSLRAVVDLEKLGPRTVWIDCDVLQADGGTRTASITGACVATAMAFNRLLQQGRLTQQPLKKKVAAISVGVFNNQALLDLCYEEDRDAEVDCNLVMCEDGQFVEIQGSGEETTFSEAQLTAMLGLGKKGITELCKLQDEAIRASEPKGVVTAPPPGAAVSLADAFGKK
jgi:ribonuclease PH